MEHNVLEGLIVDALRNGYTVFVDKDFDPNCDGVTRYTLRFWDVLKNHIDLNDIVRADMLYDEDEWHRLLLTDVYGKEFYFYGVASGYGGEGPRGAIQILTDCGFNSNDVELVYSETIFTIYK